MPSRWIKESCRTSKSLASVSHLDERLYWRLVTCADDFGRFLADPAVVKGSCFPLLRSVSIADVHKSLHALARANLVILYEIDDTLYGMFPKWTIHQGTPRAVKSKYPEPPVRTDANNCMQGHADVNNCKQMSPSSSSSSSSSSNSISSLKRPAADGEVAARFEAFWQAYPARNGKKLERATTESRFAQLPVQDQALAARAARHYAEALSAQGLSAKDPKRFLRDGRGSEPWRDWIHPAAEPDGGVQAKREAFLRGPH